MAKRSTRKAPRSMFSANPLASRETILRVLDMGGARGNYGFGRYPEGVFASVRHMVVVRAVRA